MDRRNFIKTGTLLASASAVTNEIYQSPTLYSNHKTSFKVGFVSDIHVRPDEISQAGMRKALRHINNLIDKPSFLINGGDSIMDALAANKDDTQVQWDVWNKIMEEENKLPVYHCIGNHDIWGWQVDDENIKNDPLYDKNWALKQFKIPNRYYSFDKENWRFIVLDSTQKNEKGYIARIDEEQFTWLQHQLLNTPAEKFICIVSHIPIISFCSAMFFDDMLPNGDWKLSRVLLHVDARRLKHLFKSHPNIKACLSGHIHLQDEVHYLGIKYLCNGAVSGNWWKGSFQDFAPAYALLDFHSDGTVEREIVNYDQ